MKKLKKRISQLFFILSIVMVAWYVISFIEIGFKKIEPNMTYSEYNIIYNMCEYFVK